jgi:hypothetical protein
VVIKVKQMGSRPSEPPDRSGSPLADKDGFHNDVIQALKELKVPVKAVERIGGPDQSAGRTELAGFRNGPHVTGMVAHDWGIGTDWRLHPP